ncbi:5630_t:CDS:1, partial [Cetraspora pellucida]
MSNELYETLCEFLVSSPLKQISVVPVVYKAIAEDPWASQEILKDSIKQAVETTMKKISNSSRRYKRLIKIPQQVGVFCIERCLMIWNDEGAEL